MASTLYKPSVTYKDSAFNDTGAFFTTIPTCLLQDMVFECPG